MMVTLSGVVFPGYPAGEISVLWAIAIVCSAMHYGVLDFNGSFAKCGGTPCERITSTN